MARAMITYPTGLVLGVVDDPAAAHRLAAALAADGTADPGSVEVLAGPEGRVRLGRLGPRPRPWSRLVRLVQFLSMDQLPDFLVHERAVEAGRAVLAVAVPGGAQARELAPRLEAGGAHFLNHYGRLWTEELTLWRGPELDLPDPLRR